MNILLTGSGGFIGQNLKKYLSSYYNVFSPRSYELDITNTAAVINYFNNNNIDFIIHCSSIGGIRGKEDDEKDKSSEEIIKYINENNYNFPVLFDEEKTVFREFNSITVPTIMIIDEKGNQVYKRSSSEIDVEQIMSYLN